MKKTIFIAVILSCFAFNATAGVQFLPNALGAGTQKKTKRFRNYVTDIERCANAGYKFSSCGDLKINKECPYKRGFYSCCPVEYRFTKKECLAKNLQASPTSCGGYFKCQ